MDNKFKPLIDARNADLWKELREAYNIKLEKSEEPGYLTSFGEDAISIQVDMDDLKPACFTHELLHIYMKHREVLIAKDLKEAVNDDPEVRELFSDSLKEHLGNCLEHVKMLPLYLERGFRNKDFVRDFNDRIMEESEFQELREEYQKEEGVYSRNAFDRYVGKYFSMQTSNNREYDYSEFYEGMEELDPQLFRVLQEFWENWQEYEPEDPRDKYQEMLKKLINGLREWKQGKNIAE